MSIPVNYSAWIGRARMLVHQAFWIFPMIAIIGGILTATYVSRLNFTTSASLGGLLTTGGPVGARNLVETVASTSLTVVTIVFSVTIVALQVAAAQYSPRVPRQFIRDRATQLTLAVFIFTFVYCLAVLRSIREDMQVVPQFAVTVAFLLALISVAAFVYFVHHIVHAIRIEQILRLVEKRTVAALLSNYERREEDDPEPDLLDIPDRAVPVLATSSGIIQRVNAELLLSYAVKNDLIIQYVYMLGDQAVKDTALAWVWASEPEGNLPSPEKDLQPRITRSLQIGRERSVQADVAFGLTQLVDIALRAVSTAINDPTTACASIRSAEIVLVQLCKHRLGDLLLRDDDDVVRVAVPRRAFEAYLDMVVTPLRRTCPADMAVMLRLSEMLADVGRAAVESAEQSDHVAHHMALVKRAVIPRRRGGGGCREDLPRVAGSGQGPVRQTTEAIVSLRPSATVRAATFFLVGGVTSTLFYWVVGLAAFLLAVILSAHFYTEILWFDELGYLDVYLTVVKTKIWMGAVPFLFMTGLVAGNMSLAYKLARADRVISADERRVDAWRRAFEPYFRPLVITVSLICGLVVGLQTYPRWQTYILWANRMEWGRNDPQFGRDLSYFMFELSLHVLINHWLFVCVLVALLLTLVTSYIFGGIRPQAPNSMLPFQVNLHISALVFALMALIGWGMLLQLHLLSYSERGVVTGLGFTDSNASLLAYKFVAAAVVSGFVMFQVNIRRPGWIIPTIVIVYLILFGLSIVRFYPNLFQLVIVEPQELERERPYIEDHLQFTRYGFGLDHVDRLTASVADTGNIETIQNDRHLLETLRLWDPATLLINFRELQAFRAYYDFKNIDVDRYLIGGELQPVMIAAREIDTEQLPKRSRRWESERLIYTHGYGLVSAAVSEATPAGMPVFLTSDVPTGGSGPTFVRNPQIYFGESSPEFSIVKTRTIELDRPREGRSFAKHEYTADTGVKIDGLFSRLLFAINFWDIRLALTTLLTADSRVLYHRNVRERVRRIVPFLEVDADPYPIAADGRIKWVVDCYTTSDMMPYSKRINLADFSQIFQGKQEDSGIIPSEFIRLLERRASRANYVRGSVKAVVDAYDGSVDLYITDPSDRVLQAWHKAFPGIFKPVEEASPLLKAHFRYPQDLFQIQSVIWADYHMRASDAYYTREGAWRIPKDADFISLRRERERPDHEQRNVDLRPYWLRTRFPGQTAPEFAIVQPFSPENRNVLSGYLVGGSDNDRLGRLTSYSFPPDSTVIGPAQAQARIDQDARISAWMTLRMQSGSRVSRGRLLAVPLDNAILYVQPLFVQADKSSVSELLGAQLASVPELKQVVMVFGDRVLMRPTLKGAVAALFGEASEEPEILEKPHADAARSVAKAGARDPER